MLKIKTETIYFGLLILYLINQVFSESQLIAIRNMNSLLSISRYIILVLLVLLIFLYSKISVRLRYLLLAIFVAVITTNLVVADGGLSFIPVVLFMIAAQKYPVEKVFRVTILTLISAHVFVMFMAKVGIIEDTVDFRYIGNYAGSFFSGAYYRHNMGFLVHNQIALAFFVIYMLFIAYRGRNIKWYENLAIMILNYFIFLNFGSRIVFILTVAACMAYYLVKFWDGVHKMGGGRPAVFIIYPLCCILSFAAAMSYNNSGKISIMLDLFFNNRLRLANEAIAYYGIGILGAGQSAGTYNSVELLDNTVDNGYISVFLQGGIFVGLIVIGIWTYLTYMSSKKGNRFLTLVLFLLAIENLVNYHLGSYKVLPFFCMLLNDRDLFWEGQNMCKTTRDKVSQHYIKVRKSR